MSELLPASKTTKPLRFRLYDRWIDTKTFRRKFGIQAKTDDWKLWRHVAENGEALIFDTKEEAEAKLDALSSPRDAP